MTEEEKWETRTPKHDEEWDILQLASKNAYPRELREIDPLIESQMGQNPAMIFYLANWSFFLKSVRKNDFSSSSSLIK